MPALFDFCTAAELGCAYQANRVDPCDEAERNLYACVNADPAIFIALTPEHARKEAKASAKCYANGCPLDPSDGVPLVWKDLFDLVGTVTTASSLVHRHAPVASHDCTVTERLQSYGMVSTGKANLSEFVYWSLGLNPYYVNPLNLHDRSTPDAPGGSSSGTAVASGSVTVGIGADASGSIRVPVAFDGLVGYKPSIGRVDKTGMFALSNSLYTIGTLARTAEDCAQLDCAMSVLVQAGVQIEQRTLPELDEVQRVTQVHTSLTAAKAYCRHRVVIKNSERQKIDQRVMSRLEHRHTMSALDLLEIQSARFPLATRVANNLNGAMVRW